MSRSEWRQHEFAIVLHWAGVALLAYFLVYAFRGRDSSERTSLRLNP